MFRGGPLALSSLLVGKGQVGADHGAAGRVVPLHPQEDLVFFVPHQREDLVVRDVE